MFKYKVPSENVPFLKPWIRKNYDYTIPRLSTMSTLVWSVKNKLTKEIPTVNIDWCLKKGHKIHSCFYVFLEFI